MTDDPKPAPSRWTPQAVAGLLCLIGATVLRRVLDDHTGRDLADALMVLGGSLLGWAPSLPPIKPPDGKGGGGGATGLIVGFFLASLTMLAPGCGSIERSGEVLELRYKPDPKRPPPACLYTLTLDGEVIQRGTVDDCRVPHG